MSYPKKVLKLRPTKGLVSDTPASEVAEDYYTNGSNIQFRKGFAGRVLGSRPVYGTLPVAVQHMLNARIQGTNFWLFAGANTIYANETHNSNNVTGSALQSVVQPFQYSSTILNGIPVINNSLDAPRYWNGSVADSFVDLPDWPAGTICNSIAAFRFHLFALGIDGPSGNFEDQVKWSAAADPGAIPASWTPLATNDAGDFELSDTPGPALLAVPIRGSMLIYKRSSTYAVDFVGGNDVFSLRTLFTSSGALTSHAACDVNGQHFVVTDGDIILTDGTNRQSIGQSRMREFLFNQLDQTNYQNLFVVYHRAKNEVHTFFPESGSQYATLDLVYDVSADAFSVKDVSAVTCADVGVVNDTSPSEAWDDDSATWDSDTSYWNAENFSLATESFVFGSNTTATMTDTNDLVAIAASVGKYDMTFDDPERLKFVKRIHVRATPGFGTLYVRAGSRMSTTDTITWSPEQALIEPSGLINTFATGRYISVEIRSQDTNVWTVTGIDIEAEVRGYF